jgi:hypothetical protein
MTDAHPAPDADAAAEHHDDQADPAGHGDDHGAGHEHEGESLGPIDVAAWGAGLLGLAIGGVTALAYAVSTGYL